MKTLFFLVCFTVTSLGFAQSGFVLKAGSAFSNFASRTTTGTAMTHPGFNFKFGGYLGAALDVSITEKFSLMPGLTFIERGGSMGKIERNSVFYADIPVSLRYRFGNRIAAELAPVFSYRLFATSYSTVFSHRSSTTDAFEPVAVGLSGGISIGLTEQLSVSVNYYRAINKTFSFVGRDENNQPSGEIIFYNYSISAGVEYKLKGK